MDSRFMPKPARDGSDHYDMRCQYCKHSAYVQDERGAIPGKAIEAALKKGEFPVRCPHCKKTIVIPKKGA